MSTSPDLPPSDLAVIAEMLTSSDPERDPERPPSSPHDPSPSSSTQLLTPTERRRRAAAAADKREILAEPPAAPERSASSPPEIAADIAPPKNKREKREKREEMERPERGKLSSPPTAPARSAPSPPGPPDIAEIVEEIAPTTPTNKRGDRSEELQRGLKSVNLSSSPTAPASSAPSPPGPLQIASDIAPPTPPKKKGEKRAKLDRPESAKLQNISGRRKSQLKKALLTQESLEMEEVEDRARRWTCPVCGRVEGSHVCEAWDSDQELRSPIKRLFDKVKKTVRFKGVVYPDTDDEGVREEEEGEGCWMSGGLQNGDRSESERAGKERRRSRFKEELGDAAPVEEETLVGDLAAADGAVGGAEARDGDTEDTSTEAKKKTGKGHIYEANERTGRGTIRLTRSHKRVTTGDGRVVESESETEYYETEGPVNGCVCS